MKIIDSKKFNDQSIINITFAVDKKKKKLTCFFLGLHPMIELAIYSAISFYCYVNNLNDFTTVITEPTIQTTPTQISSISIRMCTINNLTRTCFFII